MRRKAIKRKIDEQLLEAIISMKQEWQQIGLIIEKSIEPTEEIMFNESLAKAKYLFLLREARYRELTAIRFN